MFPTCVGMNRLIVIDGDQSMNVPHMRGDEPAVGVDMGNIIACSPHAWG